MQIYTALHFMAYARAGGDQIAIGIFLFSSTFSSNKQGGYKVCFSGTHLDIKGRVKFFQGFTARPSVDLYSLRMVSPDLALTSIPSHYVDMHTLVLHDLAVIR